jgi:hypothetical protein
MAIGQGFNFNVPTPSGVYKPNQFHLDYYAVSINKPIPIEDLERLHVGDVDGIIDFAWSDLGPYTKQSPSGVTYRQYGANAGDGTGTAREWWGQVVNSGMGCQNFGNFYPRFVEYCQQNDIAFRGTRVDISYNRIMKKNEWLDFCKGAFSSSFNVNSRWHYTGQGASTTIYYGTRTKSHRFFRVYNKTLEAPDFTLVDDDGNVIVIGEDEYIIRFEVEYKKETMSSLSTNGTRHKHIYEVDSYIDWIYSDEDKLMSLLGRDWRFLSEFGLELKGEFFKIEQNQSFVQFVII